MAEKQNARPQPGNARLENLATGSVARVRTLAQRNQDIADELAAAERARRAEEELEFKAANESYSKAAEERPISGFLKWLNNNRTGKPEQFSVPSQNVREKQRAEIAKGLRGKLMKLGDLDNMPPAKPLIKGILDLDSESWLIGQAGGFKSFIAVDWACHVAAGKSEWRGHKVNAGDVLYVVAEGARGFRKRVQAWAQKHGVKPERLLILPMPVPVSDGMTIGVGIEWQELTELAREIKPALIVLDTQARMTAGLEENSAKDMGIWVKGVSMLREASNGCVLVVHHTGRNGGDARGSSAIDAAQDMEWKVERKAHELAAVLKCDKSKDGDDRTRFRFSMDLVEVGQDEDGQPITSLVPGDSLDETEAREGTEVLAAIGKEADSWNTQDWIMRTLEETASEGQGIAKTTLLTLINGARKLAEPPLAPMNRNTYFSAVKRLIESDQIEARGARLLPVPGPFDA